MSYEYRSTEDIIEELNDVVEQQDKQHRLFIGIALLLLAFLLTVIGILIYLSYHNNVEAMQAVFEFVILFGMFGGGLSLLLLIAFLIKKLFKQKKTTRY
jgi:hypothetical protein